MSQDAWLETSPVSNAANALVNMPRLVERSYAEKNYVSVGIQTDISCIVDTEYFGPSKRKNGKDAQNIATALLSSITFPSYNSTSSLVDRVSHTTSDWEQQQLDFYRQQQQQQLDRQQLDIYRQHQQQYDIYRQQQQQYDIYQSSDDEVIKEKVVKLARRYKVGLAERYLGVCLYPTEEEINGIYGTCIKRGVIGQVHKRNYYVEIDGVRKRHNTTCLCSRSRGTRGLVCYNCETIGCNGLTCDPQYCRVRIEPVEEDPFTESLESECTDAPAHNFSGVETES